MFSKNFYETLRSPLFHFVRISIIPLYIFQLSLQRHARASLLIFIEHVMMKGLKKRKTTEGCDRFCTGLAAKHLLESVFTLGLHEL